MAQKLTPILVRKFIPGRKQDSRKGQNGKVLVVGGSYVYHGAPVLASLAALRAGTDLVYTAIPKINASATRVISPNLIVIPMVDAKLTRGSANKLLGQVQSGLDSATIGMGLAIADEEGLKNLVKSLLDQDVRLALDASALVGAILPVIPGKNVVLAPHAGEFQRLFGVLPSNKIKERITLVERFAKDYQTTILLKGATDVISNGNQTYISPKNLASMTVGGTGDDHRCPKKTLTATWSACGEPRDRRDAMMKATEQLSSEAGVSAACQALAVPRSSFYRVRRLKQAAKPRPAPQRALSQEERVQVRETLNSERFQDSSPREVYATLLDESTYLCSWRTMYRVLEAHQEVRERRNQLRHPVYSKPELLATSPNQLWSWDITKLKGPVKWTYYYLYTFSMCSAAMCPAG